MFDANGNPIIDVNRVHVHLSCLDVLLREMGAWCTPLEQETQIFIISELLFCKRHSDEEVFRNRMLLRLDPGSTTTRSTTSRTIHSLSLNIKPRFVIIQSPAQIQLNNLALPHAIRAG